MAIIFRNRQRFEMSICSVLVFIKTGGNNFRLRRGRVYGQGRARDGRKGEAAAAHTWQLSGTSSLCTHVALPLPPLPLPPPPPWPLCSAERAGVGRRASGRLGLFTLPDLSSAASQPPDPQAFPAIMLMTTAGRSGKGPVSSEAVGRGGQEVVLGFWTGRGRG